jgi:D-alanyl-D-alanine carboxypeptidase/D-alanyl-D-alanine-endopeptidase (penicillin-binding protein 4)
LKNSILTQIALVIIALTTAPPLYANIKNICPAQLPTELEKVVQSPQLKTAHVGIFVQTNAPKPQVLTNFDGDRYFLPASNIKLFTTAAALKLLGADYRFTTYLRSPDLPNSQGELEHGLWLVGAGDPSFSSEAGLKSLVAQLKAKGVNKVKGGLWAIASSKSSEIVDSWEWSDLQHYYAALVSPFTINENALNWEISPDAIGKTAIFRWEKPILAEGWIVDNQAITVSANSAYTLKVIRPYGQKRLVVSGQIPEKSEPELGGVAIPDPEANFLNLLRQELTIQGIQVVSDNLTNINRTLPLKHNLAISLSPPISELISTTNKDSNNLYAELLLRALGDRFDQDSPDRLDSGLMAINQYLQSLNISSNQLILVDGSGLSRQNMTTPRAIVQLLQAVSNDQNFRRSLPISNFDGTLKTRFKNEADQGKIEAKTGSFTATMALSGYAKPQNYNEVIFSIIINNSNLSYREMQQYIDAIARIITRLKSC